MQVSAGVKLIFYEVKKGLWPVQVHLFWRKSKITVKQITDCKIKIENNQEYFRSRQVLKIDSKRRLYSFFRGSYFLNTLKRPYIVERTQNAFLNLFSILKKCKNSNFVYKIKGYLFRSFLPLYICHN
jgi:hypothetical protein